MLPACRSQLASQEWLRISYQSQVEKNGIHYVSPGWASNMLFWFDFLKKSYFSKLLSMHISIKKTYNYWHRFTTILYQRFHWLVAHAGSMKLCAKRLWATLFLCLAMRTRRLVHGWSCCIVVLLIFVNVIGGQHIFQVHVCASPNLNARLLDIPESDLGWAIGYRCMVYWMMS